MWSSRDPRNLVRQSLSLCSAFQRQAACGGSNLSPMGGRRSPFTEYLDRITPRLRDLSRMFPHAESISAILLLGLFLALVAHVQLLAQSPGQRASDPGAQAPSKNHSDEGKRSTHVVTPAPRSFVNQPIVVNTTSDELNSDANTSLREAIVQANAQPGSDTILLPEGTLVLSISGFGDASVGDLNLIDPNGEVIIQGISPARTIIDAGRIDRAFSVGFGVTAVFQQVSITNGRTDNSNGGGILNLGSLTLIHCSVFGNHALSEVLPEGPVNSDRESTSGASATFPNPETEPYPSSNLVGNPTVDGGGVFNLGTLRVIASSIHDNGSAYSGGGVASAGLLLEVERSTISKNVAGIQGGGVAVLRGSAQIRNSTITSNSTGLNFGGGIGGVATIIDCIIADNDPFDCSGELSVEGHNLIERVHPGACSLHGDLNTLVLGVEPLLQPLGDYGGPTQTHALQARSPAIDVADCTGLDQRGETRPFLNPRTRLSRTGNGCDLGAFEFTCKDDAAAGTLEVPVRWCAVKGTPALDGLTESERDEVIKSRTADASIVLVTAGNTELVCRPANDALLPHIPMLDDPDPNIGDEGDVFVDVGQRDFGEFLTLMNECRQAWNKANLPGGVTAVLISKFVDANGLPTDLVGVGGRALEGDCAGQLSAGRIMVVDPRDVGCVYLDQAHLAKTLAHEAGHAMSLRHGDGLDDNGDSLIDDQEVWDPDGLNLMEYGIDPNTQLPGKELTSGQTCQAREHSLQCVPGARPNGQTPLEADLQPSTTQTASDPGRIKILSFGIVLNNGNTSTLFTEVVESPLPTIPHLGSGSPLASEDSRYTFYADLDPNGHTGGSIPSLGLQGIDMIGVVSVVGGGIVADVRVFDPNSPGGGFVSPPASGGISARVNNLTVGTVTLCGQSMQDDPEVGASIQLTIPNAILGDAGWDVGQVLLVEASAEALDVPDPNNPGTPLREDAGPSPLLNDFLATPATPSCTVTPHEVSPGDTVAVNAIRFLPSSSIRASFDTTDGPVGIANTAGELTLQLTVPVQATTGFHLVSASDLDTALQAACTVMVSNAVPTALCHDVTVPISAESCSAPAKIDAGSFDPDGDPITLEQDPTGPYAIGMTDVTLIVTDDKGASSTCTGKVTVTPDPQTTRDSDRDGIVDCLDNCMLRRNPDQGDRDRDGIGDACDNCVRVGNNGQDDHDADRIGDACDNCVDIPNRGQGDRDHDGVGDSCDNCMREFNPDQADSDHDGRGNVCDHEGVKRSQLSSTIDEAFYYQIP